jgi:hypothetical protein
MFEARIARGISVLDQHLPGWRERVDPDRLDMGSGLFDPATTGGGEWGACGCVLSQLDADPESHTIGEYRDQLDVVCAMADPDGQVPDDRWAAEHGFALAAADYQTEDDDAAAYRQLTAEWRQALTAGPHGWGWSA